MNEQLPREIYHERLTTTAKRFEDRVLEGIQAAQAERTEIASGTARLIGHALGRAYGRASALAEFGRTGTGTYESLREEYLDLYTEESTPPEIREWIDWFGTHLIQREGLSLSLNQMARPEHGSPKLENILVPTGIEVGDWYCTVNVPGIYSAAAITGLTETLTELRLDEDAGLRAFLALPGVNAMSGDIMQDFHDNHVGTFVSAEEALHEIAEVDELERDVTEYANERHIFIEQVTPDYEALQQEADEGYDFVEAEGRVYVFYK